MNRRLKIAGMLSEKNVDAIVLTSPVSIRYALGTKIGGLVIVTKNGEGFTITDGKFSEYFSKTVEDKAFKCVVSRLGAFSKDLGDICTKLGVKTLAFEEESISYQQWKDIGSFASCDLVPLKNGLVKLMAIKDQNEVDSIIKAQRLAESVFAEALDFIRPGVTDIQLDNFLQYKMGEKGNESGFKQAVVGKATSMVAAKPTGVPITDGMFVLMDFGATINGYYSDMTRTVAVGHATDKMIAAYNAVYAANEAAFNAMKPGAFGKEIDAAAREQIIKAGFEEHMFTHGLGHSVGLTLGGVPMANQTSEDVFETGMVCTDEPGIYIPDEFGIRIEDMVWLSPEGRKNLTLADKSLIIL